jgi:hypothetical protein
LVYGRKLIAFKPIKCEDFSNTLHQQESGRSAPCGSSYECYDTQAAYWQKEQLDGRKLPLIERIVCEI